MIYECERRATARRAFMSHKATMLINTDEFFAFDWRRADGSSNYHVRYMLDIKRGEIHITGDLGNAIASWWNEVKPQDMYCYINTVDYFLSKIECSDTKYTYYDEDIKEDLLKIKEEYLLDAREGGMDESELDDDFEQLEQLLTDCSYGENIPYPDEAINIFEKYNEDWWESDFCDIGKRISQRVYLWIEGFRMGCRMLGVVEKAA